MSSVSAACIFDAYSASSAHTDTFYIVSQIVRVRNSKRHFSQNSPFRISFSRSASPYGNIDHNRLTYTLRPHQPQPPRLHSTATSTTTAPLHPTATLTTARNFAQQSRLNSSAENFSYFLKKPLTNTRKPCIMFTVIWVWRRLVARYLGVVEAAGSNPVTQTS